MSKHQLRLLLCAGVALGLMIFSLFMSEWFQISIDGLGALEQATFTLDLRSAKACLPTGACAIVPMARFQGFYSTISAVTFYGNCTLGLIVAYQAGLRIFTGRSGEALVKLGYIGSIICFFAVGATGYLFEPEAATGSFGTLGIVSVNVIRSWAPALLLAADALAFIALHLAVAEELQLAMPSNALRTSVTAGLNRAPAISGESLSTQGPAAPRGNARDPSPPILPEPSIRAAERPSDRPTLRPVERPPTVRPAERPSDRPTLRPPERPPTVRPPEPPSDRPTTRLPERPVMHIPDGPPIHAASVTTPHSPDGAEDTAHATPAVEPSPPATINSSVPDTPAAASSSHVPAATVEEFALAGDVNDNPAIESAIAQLHIESLFPPVNRPAVEHAKPHQALEIAETVASAQTPNAGARPNGTSTEPALRGKLNFATIEVLLSTTGIDAKREDGIITAVSWADIVGVVARRLPSVTPYDGETFVDVVSTAGSTLRILPWTELAGEELHTDSTSTTERARALVQFVASRCPAAQVDNATRIFLGGRGMAAQLSSAELLAQHDERLS